MPDHYFPSPGLGLHRSFGTAAVTKEIVLEFMVQMMATHIGGTA
jgi:hypothetical protein